MKKNLCIGFTDTFDGCADFFTEWLSEKYNVIRNDAKPDYLIFGPEDFGQNNLQYEDCIKIFYTGENRRFWNYKCHYGITFDHIDNERHYRLPLYVINLWYLQNRCNLDIRNRIIKPKTSFCGFVNSNPHCTVRNDFFHKLSTYKKVDSGGPLFNNIGYIVPRDEKGIQNKMEFLSTRKFTICYENGSYAGYVTEKALEAHLSGSIPLYWGSPTVALDFNEKALLNWHDFSNDDTFIEQIKRVDESDDLYVEMIEQPLFKGWNRSVEKYIFLDWFDRNVYKGSRV